MNLRRVGAGVGFEYFLGEVPSKQLVDMARPRNFFQVSNLRMHLPPRVVVM